MSENKNTPHLTRIFIIGCSFLACIVLLAMTMIFAAMYREKLPIISNYFSTATAAITTTPRQTPTPHLLIEPASKDTFVLKEDFTTNKNDWSSYYSSQKVEVKDGKLFLESFYAGNTGIAECYCKAPLNNQFADKYYFQVDVSTESATDESYGLIFSLSPEEGFYIFTVTNRQFYALDKRSVDKWDTLASGTSRAILPYPVANTLSVYFDNGEMRLYINGQKVISYKDKKPIKKGELGMYVNDGNFKLIADNLFAYSIK